MIENFLKGLKGKKLKKDQLLLALLVGVLLLVIAMPGGEKKQEDSGISLSESGEETEPSEDAYLRQLERRLENILSEMDGAGEVSVMITLAASKEKVVEKDRQESQEQMTENDSQGGSRVTKNTSSGETTVNDEKDGSAGSPYVSKELSPEVEGVVVISSGGDDAVVVKNITEAVQALFGIDTHKIRIVKGRREA